MVSKVQITMQPHLSSLIAPDNVCCCFFFVVVVLFFLFVFFLFLFCCVFFNQKEVVVFACFLIKTHVEYTTVFRGALIGEVLLMNTHDICCRNKKKILT